MAAKCANCAGASGEPPCVFCVETNQLLCKRCVGALTYPGTKGNEWTLEPLRKMEGLQTVTIIIANISIFCLLVFTLSTSTIGDNYFRGESTCPGLSLGRQTLARWDANVFYYFKRTLAEMCDLEDSFWRLLLDGWIRGVVAGTDSLLLLGATILKAWIFKTAVSVFLQPVFGALYVVFGEALCLFLEQGRAAVTMSSENHRVTKRVQKVAVWFLKFPTKLKEYLTKKRTFFAQAQNVCRALALSVSLRLLMHALGWTRLAVTNNAQVSIWQLWAEPIFFYYVGKMMFKINATLDKKLWKKAAAAPAFPLTDWRKKPMKDVMELVDYTKKRWTRRWGYYKGQANNVLHLLFDEAFNLVVLLRLAVIMFSLGPVIRQGAIFMGMGGMIQRQSEWFTHGTGLAIDDASYLSDRLSHFGFLRVIMFGKWVVSEGLEEGGHEVDFTTGAILSFGIWRIALPAFLAYLSSQWAKMIKGQQDRYKKEWKGKDWTGGAYHLQLQEHGSFWNIVTAEQWSTPFVKAPPPPPKKGGGWGLIKKAIQSKDAALGTTPAPVSGTAN